MGRRFGVLVLGLGMILAGCGSSSGPTTTFVLQAPPSPGVPTATPAASAAASPSSTSAPASASAAPTTASGAPSNSAPSSPAPSESAVASASGSASASPSTSESASASPSTSESASASPAASGAGSIATALQQAFVDVVNRVSPSVVVIETSSGLGSGVVFDDQGNIVTNAHVVGGDTRFKVTTADGHQYDATLVGAFVADDLAVIRVSGASLHPATFGDSAKLVVGDIVLAIGNPLGLQSSVTEGIVSAVGRTVSEPGGAALPGVIQTSAPINPGNSGGALVNLAGEVIGIPTLAATDPQLGGSAPGIGFAIPGNRAKDIAEQLIKSGRVTNSHRAYIGIRAADVQGAPGVYVYSVDANGPAAKAGIKPNELILSIGGKPTPDTGSLSEVLAALSPGAVVKVEVLHTDGTRTSVDVTLGELPG